jgi:hypothetical protein
VVPLQQLLVVAQVQEALQVDAEVTKAATELQQQAVAVLPVLDVVTMQNQAAL